MDNRLEQAPIGVIETTTEGAVVAVNEAAATMIETAPGALRGTDLRDRFPRSAAGTLRDMFEGGAVSRSFEEYYPELDRWLAVDVQVGETVLVYVRDRTESHESEQQVERLERRLERIERINTLVVTVLQQVIGASDRGDIGRMVCEELGGTDLYRFVWVGEREFPDGRLRPLAAAGDAPDLHDRIDETLDEGQALPERMAVESGETRLVGSIAEDDAVTRAVRRAAFGHGLRSCLAVPLAYQGTVYGVVSVYSDREEGFSEQERVGLETLGRIAGFAVRALRQEDLLVADTVTEVTLAVRDETIPFVEVAREADCRLSLDGAVPRGDGTVVCYLGTGDGESDDGGDDEDGVDLAETLRAHPAVTGVRSIRSEGEPLVQVTVDGEMPVTALVAWGATVRSAEYTAESARLVAEAPPEDDIRRMVEAVDGVAVETTLVSKEERTRTADTAEAFHDALAERLTDRQRTVLRTAHLSDYFTSPRGSTSEEVADTLDIAGSTMLYHLRRAQQELVDAFFEADGEPATTDEEPSAPDDH
ncbi:bacterio-opsin activator domain-containing protein [Haloglomus litoreum]|uniref:bacterio-opsin activator domain-containing protein n=1 Tax=Haloglomus litoreum TaxID=3034026 RepID=UPI0023E8FA05|nr:bacterio-opsin activator domain-containing protein [Haloglomus sp. DT116]